MLITLIFSDATKEYDLDVKAFPTIADYIESCGETTMTIPEYFNSSSMDLLLYIIEDFQEPVKHGDLGCYDIKYIDINYLDMLFSEYIGISLFEVKCTIENETIKINLLESSEEQYTALKKIKTLKLTENGLEYEKIEFECGAKCPEVKFAGYALLYTMEENKSKNTWGDCDSSLLLQAHNILTHLYGNTYSRCKINHTIFRYYSRINVIWERVNWHIIEIFYNNVSIRPFISKYINKLHIYNKDSEISIITKYLIDKYGKYFISSC